MSNEHRGEAAIKLGDTEYTFSPHYSALAEMESKAGAGIIELTKRCTTAEYGGTFDFTLKDVHAVFSAAIKGGGAKVPDNLGELILQMGIVKAAGIAGGFLLKAIMGGQQGNAEAAKE